MDATRPIGVGYLREHVLMSAREVAQAKAAIVAFASAEGFTLQGIYVERLETAPAAFEALIEAANRFEAKAVLVPSLRHFAVPGAPSSMKDRVERSTGAQVLVAAATS